MTTTNRTGSHLAVVPDPTPASSLSKVSYETWASRRVQDFAERTWDENPLIVANECGLLLGHPVDVTDLCDLAEALEDVRRAEDPREETLRQPSVDEITARIVRGPQPVCAVQS